MSELFSKEQAGRLFGIIAAGASVGGLVGPSVPAFFTGSLGTDNPMLIASVMLLLTIPIIFHLQTLKLTAPNERIFATAPPKETIGGTSLAGFKLFFSNPYLLCIALFIFLYTGVSSFVYFELKNYSVSSRGRSERQSGANDLAVNILSISTGLLVTGRIVSKFGMPVTIALIPLAICLGFSCSPSRQF